MKYQKYLILSLVLLINNGGAVPRVLPSDDDASYAVVDTGVGSIRGLRAEDGDYSMFMGIPYAQVDPDNLFGEAKPYPNFESTFDAFDDSSICPQREEFNDTIVGSLDCLHINIYVPDSASYVNRLPVFVWIFGGGFNLGFPGRYLYGPSFLVRHDVIFVTLNYRLGPYGFMCLDIPEVPGNQGLKDQVMALRWIRDNIEAFGGDNSKITIGGNSAGAISVDFHLYYGQEENLFHKIIPQSGASLVQGSIGIQNPGAPFELAEFLNYTASDVKDALTFLATVNPHQLIAATEESGITHFSPCVENKFENVENFITEHPVNLGVPRVKDIEVLIGFNNDEMYHGFALIPDIVLQFTDVVRVMINMCFDFEKEDELYAEMHDIVTHFYLGDYNITAITAEQRQGIIDLSTDFSFIHPVLRAVKKYLDYGVQTMYLYMFSYSGERNFSKHRLNITGGGASHADELGYLFDISYMDKALTPEDQLIVDRITELWTNFIKYGNPTPEPTELVPVLWQPVSRDTWHYLEIDSQVRVGTRPLHDRMAFLDLFYNANEIYERGYNRETETEEPELEPEPEAEPVPEGPSSGKNIILDISLPAILILTYLLQ